MDVNEIIYEFKMLNGIGKMLKTSLSDEELAEIIINISRKTFSHYFKHTIRLEGVCFDDTLKVSNNTYRFPDIFLKELAYDDIKISGIKNITIHRPMKTSAVTAAYTRGALGLVSQYRGTSDNLMATSVMRRRLDTMRGPLRWMFRSPDKIEFKHIIEAYQAYDLELNTTHAKSLATIDEGYAEAFKELSFLDLKIVLWNSEFKYLDGTSVGDSTIELKLESFQNAENDKKELLANWRENFVMDTPRIISANY